MSEPIKIIHPSKNFDRTKISFSSSIEKKNGISSIRVGYDGTSFRAVAKNCIIKSIKESIQGDTTHNILLFQLTDEKFISMIKEYDDLLIANGYLNSMNWFNTNNFSINVMRTMLKSRMRYHPTYGYSIGGFTSISYIKNNLYNDDCLLFKKNNTVDVCFSFNKVRIVTNDNEYTSPVFIEKVQKIKYIGPWCMRIHNETSKSFNKFIMTILLCNIYMKEPLCNDMLIYIFEFLQTF